jgi:hypothetical protein
MVIKDFIVELPPGDWNGAIIEPYSVWGNGNQGRDHWGWPNMASMDVGSVYQTGGGGWEFKIFLAYDNINSSELIFMCRIRKEKEYHVWCKFFKL